MNKSSRSLHLPLVVDHLLIALTILVLGLAVCAVLLSALPLLISMLLVSLIATLGSKQIRRVAGSPWRVLIIDPEQGHSLVDADGSSVDCSLLGHGSAGPWLMLRIRDENDRVHELALRRTLLGESQWRRLRALLRLLSDDELVGHQN